MASLEEPTFSGTLASPFAHRGNRPTYWPAKIGDGAPRGIVVEPVAWRGSGDLRTLAEADCWIAFPAGDQKYEAGHPVDVILK